jgi:hypothetical protein
MALVGTINAPNDFGFKNRIINGAIGISQRATTGTAVAVSNGAGGTFGPDRWWGYTGTLSLWNMYQVSTGALDFPFAWRTQRIAGQTSTSASYFGQTIETNNCIHLAGQTVTISFYATAGANYSGGAATIQLLTGTAADQGTSSLNQALWTELAVPINRTFTPTTTRTRFSFTATIGASVQEMSLRFNWSGSGTAGAADYIDITGIQLEEGSIATAFDYRPFGMELALCQRYCFRLNATVADKPWAMATAYTTTSAFGVLHLPVTMRATPTITFAGTGTLRLLGSGAGFGASSSTQGGATTDAVELVGAYTGLTAGYSYWMRSATVNDWILGTAEL